MMKFIRSVTPQSFLAGVGIAAAAYVLGPQLKEMLRPLAVKGAQGVMAVGAMAGQAVSQGKETVNKAVLDGHVSHDNAGSSFHEKFLNELKEEQEMSKGLMEELRDSVKSMKVDIENIKNSGTFQQG